ncbi:hypothetical protein [Dysgonomonas sp. 520]|uniref:hypothetical protein n=1 Tax=Dysgonomonas sp. 520 TaxID=2302931 RepID=UPI0013D3D39C|nr:hypothetical protein [Dysgonomonas sp. 520]NDW10039.1 hypothetical protein [Dysgonomonas sp. 520]
MKTTNRTLSIAPEIFFILLSMFWLASNKISGEALCLPILILAFTLILQLIIKSRTLGIILGMFLFVGSLYMTVTVVTEIIKTGSNPSTVFLIAGIASFVPGIIFACLMIAKNIISKKEEEAATINKMA